MLCTSVRHDDHMACSAFPWCVRHSPTPPGGTVHHGEPVTVHAGDDVVSVALVSDEDTRDVYVELSTGTDPVMLTGEESRWLVVAIAGQW